MPKATAPVRDPRKIFVVHGRDLTVRDQLIKFLRHIDTWPISWTEARNATGKPSPTTLEIVETGLAMAQAIVVLFTPDDSAKLDSRFLQNHDGDEERNYGGQARQNVILEAGMALGMAPEKTVMVRFGSLRRISDIDGVNWITLDDTYEARRALVDAIANAGVQLNERKDLLDYKEAGRFSDPSVWWDIYRNHEDEVRLTNRGAGVAKKVRVHFELNNAPRSWDFEEILPNHGIVINAGMVHREKAIGGKVHILWTSADGSPIRATVQVPSS